MAESTHRIRKLTVQQTKFITYQFMRNDGPSVDWLESLPSELDRYEIILAAGYEPEDPTVKVGLLNQAWYEHPKECLLFAYGGLREGERFTLSVDPIVLPHRINKAES